MALTKDEAQKLKDRFNSKEHQEKLKKRIHNMYKKHEYDKKYPYHWICDCGQKNRTTEKAKEAFCKKCGMFVRLEN